MLRDVKLHDLNPFYRSQESLWKGALAGVAGGLAATFVMTQAQKAMSALMPDDDSSGGDDDEPSTVKVADTVTDEVFSYELTEEQKPIAGQVVHYSTGTLGGLIYGMLAEYYPVVTTGAGLPFGTAFWVLADEVAVPAVGLAEAPWKQPVSTQAYGLAAHLVYGLTAELTRSLVRRWL